MTVNTISSIAEFDTNGVTTNFPFYFKFLASEDLVVTYIDPAGASSTLTLGTHYTVNGVGNDQGGSIITVTALAGPGQLIVSREMDAFQQTSLRNQGKFLAETHEDVFDKLTMLIQQGFAIFTRALTRPFGRDYFFAEDRRITSVKDPVDDQDAATKAWSQRYVGEVIGGAQGPINNSANVLYIYPSGIPGVVQDLSGAGGSYLVGRGSGTVGSALDDLQNQVLVLKAETDGTDQTAVVQAFFARAFSENRPWMVPPGDYTINPSAPIYIKTSGVCNGRFLVPKANQAFRFELPRDEPGIILSTSGWAQIQRGMSDVNAVNAFGKNLFLRSTEVLFERIGSGGAPYLKQEFIRCTLPTGSFSTPAVCTYNFLSNLTVTAYTPSRPITISGLSVLLTGVSGGVEANRGLIVVFRDNVILNQSEVINQNPAQPKPIAIEVGYCADVTLNSPRVFGFNYSGLGYGIINSSTIGLTVNDASIHDCRHAYTGAFTVDVTLNRGSFDRVIDDHWTDRFVANDVKVYTIAGSSAFEFAGNDIALNRPVASGGRSLVGIRVDTPSLGGRVIINSPNIFSRGEASFYYLFGFSSPNGIANPGFAYTNKPRLPDYVEISNAAINTDTPTVYGAFLGMFYVPHIAWGTVALRGAWSLSGNLFSGVFSLKDSTYQQDRRPIILVDGNFDFGVSGVAISIHALDNVTNGAYDVVLNGLTKANLRYSGKSCNLLTATSCGIASIENDDAIVAPNGVYRFLGCNFMGGTFSPGFRNHLLSSSIFSGDYSSFPSSSDISIIGCVKAVGGLVGVPANITNNVVTPFSV